MRTHLQVTQDIAQSLASDRATIPEGLSKCIDEIVKLTPKELLRHQRRQLQKLRALAESSKADDAKIISEAPSTVRSVLTAASPGGLRVALLHKYLTLIGHEDADDLRDSLSKGFPLVGAIPVSPTAPRHDVRRATIQLDELQERAEKISDSLLRQHTSRPDDIDAEAKVFSQTLEDIALGRMAPLRPPGVLALPPYTRRFGVSQRSSHGDVKVRCIDDFAQSLINDTVDIDRRIRMGSISDFVETARRLHMAFPREHLHVMKSDFQAAYRSCPIHPDHIPYSNILVRDPANGVVSVSTQWAMPFGAVSAVYAWDRLGEAITSILHKVFLFPASRYVDDLFMPVWASNSAEQRAILLEVVGIFGLVLSPAKTPPPSASMPVLGVLVSIIKDVIELTIEKERLRFWHEELSRLQGSRGIARRALASRMAGRMEFAASAAWGSVPRARFNGLYKIASKGFRGSLQAELDVEWLLRLLTASPLRTTRPLVPREDAPLILYTDASGKPQNGLGAVLADGDSILWTGCRCPDPLISSLSDRATQINPLELCGVILGLWTFREIIRGRRVIIYIDNQAALGAIKKGRSSVPDFNELVFFARGICGSEMAEPVFFWVPSDLNWSDAPSRYASPIDGFWIAPITRWQDLCAALSGK